jgi:glucose-6-phosphate 1-dehydrogenase
MSQNQKALFIIFGGTGDLAYRKLYPALYNLYKKNYLNQNFAVIGTARREWSDAYYQEVVTNAIDSIKASDEDAKEFASHFRYQSHNVKDSNHYHTLLDLADELDTEYDIEGNRVFYLSMSPRFFGTITSHLQQEQLVTKNGFNRVIIEKPFGTKYENSNDLNNEILESFDEEQIYRIDHYLGKEMVQAIIALRFGNPIFKHLWQREFISNIQVTLAEDIGVEDRGAYYEQSGALRDMGQNHILQIVSLLFMDEPKAYESDEITKEKVEALKHLKLLDNSNVREKFVRGQYDISPHAPDIHSYISENEVSKDSVVETFIAGKIESQSEKWKDVPLYVRTGKRMKAKSTRIDIVFKTEDTPLFEADELSDNVLTIHIGPDEGLTLELNSKQVGHAIAADPIQLNYEVDAELPDDYEKLLLDALEGDKTSFVHWDEVAQSWKYIDAIRDAWETDPSDLAKYPVNTNGPKEAFDLLEKDGNHWIWE